MSMNVHPHGVHQCQCVNCGYTTIVPAYVKCNELQCSACGDRMRARETGEYRGTEQGRSGIARRQE